MTPLQLAARLDHVGFSEIVNIRNKIYELQRHGAKILQFHSGEPFLETPGPVKEACVKALTENKTRYAPSSGVPELLDVILEKVRTRNRIPAEPGQAIVVSGGLHGLFVAFLSLVNPGDEVLVFSPYWTPVKDLIGLAGGHSVLVNTAEALAQGVRQRLEASITERTRVIYYNSPTNPTGFVYSRQEVEAIAEIARAHNLVVIADEAYEDLIFDGEHISLASLPGMYERTLTVFTFSKTYAMTGWRIGYVIAPDPWMMGLRKLVLYSINGVSTPTQWAAVAAMKLGDDYLEEIGQAYRQRRDLLVSGLRSAGFECEEPAGTFYAFPKINAILGGDSLKASNILLDAVRISTVPGRVFGPDGEGHLRFCFSTSKDAINEAMERLHRWSRQVAG